MTNRHELRKTLNWRLWTVAALVTVVALALAAYAAAASYESVSGLAASRGVPLPRLNPLGIDGGLAGVILFDIALTWVRQPIGWFRLVARLFAAGTIAANAAAGWPDPVGTGLRIAAPALFVILMEAARTVLLRRDRQDERIPLARWLLAFRPTFAMWRRMKLWQISSYPAALAMDLARRQAIMKLTARYSAGDWRALAPNDLVWMLDEGVLMDEALARVAELTKPEPVVQGRSSGQKKRTRSSGQKRAGSPPNKTAAGSPLKPAVSEAELGTEAQALSILAADPDISGGELGRRLGKSERYGCMLKNRLAGAAPGGG